MLAPLRIDRLAKAIGSFKLEADFSVAVGARAALVGPSGSGKTSLLRLIAGLERPDSGRVLIGEDDVTGWSPQKRAIGLVFQEQALFPHLDVLGNAAFGLQAHGMGRAEREAAAGEWLKRVDLGDRLHADVTRLSGGEKQRVAFVRAVAWKPRVLLFDEPFSALDADLRRVLRNELIDLHKLWPAPLVLVTHDEADQGAVATQRLRFDGHSVKME